MNKQINVNDLIFEKIKFRYHFMNEERLRQRNIRTKLLVDSFYPAWVAKQIVDPKNERHLGVMTKGRGYAISQRVANDLGCKQLHISELVSMLGYTKTDISKLLQSVKNKELNITLVGLGGTGSNFLHWMYEMSQWTGKEQIFNRLFMFDDDDFDIPNMLRIPFLPQFSSTDFNAKKANTIPRKFDSLANETSRQVRKLNSDFIVTARDNPLGNRTRSIIYGAPDIATREWLSSLNYTFIASTHRDNEFSLVENPAVDNDLMMETYGKINLAMFFLNHLTMTIEFLKHLSTRDAAYGGEGRQNETIIRSDFGETYNDALEGGFKAGSKKLYAIKENTATVTIDLPEEV